MSSSGALVVRFIGDTKDFDKASSSVQGKFGKVGKIAKVAAAGIAIAGAATAVVGKKLIDAGERASTSNARIEQIAKSMKLFGGEADNVSARLVKLAEKTALQTGMDQNAIKETQAKLLTFKDLAKSADTVGGAFDRATAAAVDMEAAGFGSAATNAVQLGKALNDPVKGIAALAKSGVTFNESEKKRIETLVESGKAGKAQNLILKAIETQVGGTAKATANATDRMKVGFSLVQEHLGQKLLPIVDKVAAWFIDVALPAMTKFGDYLGTVMPPIFQKIGAVIAAVMGAVNSDVAGNLAAVQGIFTNVTSIITSLWGAFGGTLTDFAVKAFGSIQQVIGGAFKIIQGIFKVFSSLLQGDWQGVWDGIKKILSGAWDVIKGVVKLALNVLGTVFKLGWTALKAIVGLAWDGIKTLVVNGIGKTIDLIKGIPGKFVSALSSLGGTVGGLFRDAMNAGKERVIDIGGQIRDWIASIPDKLASLGGKFATAGRGLLQQFIDGMKNAAGIISGIAGNVWNTIRGLLNGAISQINAALEFTIKLPAGKSITINPPNIPHLAKGGITTGPMLAMIGDNPGGREAVIPLSGPNAFDMGGGGRQVIEIRSGGSKMDDLLVELLRKAIRSQGGNVQVVLGTR